MRTFYLAIVLGVCVVGCSSKSNETAMLPTDLTAANKEITISLTDPSMPPTTEMTTTTATATLPSVSQIMPDTQTSTTALETPTTKQIQQALQN
ncbi:MAG TPA: hypothetical protein PLO93_07090, partial [Candidatus Omnitrophota bacterium]|nr:hypothetical protein [Candidatus Omnitrophota bacterium]